MALVEKTVLIEQSAARMFELVDRCEDYPAFLPWCGRTEVKFRDVARTVATLHINYHAVKSSFTTENDKVYPGLMKIRLVDGPFRRLEGSWHFPACGSTFLFFRGASGWHLILGQNVMP